MLSVEDNELICRVGPGTPMGNLMRQYWIPALLSRELPEPDSNPVRVMLLGERLIAFRDTQGRVGLLADKCSHRATSLFFGRNEAGGLRCIYHGWKYDVEGNCLETPNEPPENNFKDRIKHRAYPCVERGGLVWTYMGPRLARPAAKGDPNVTVELPGVGPVTGLPPLPDIEANMGEHARANASYHECNYLQVAEGAIDTSHAGFLHFGSLRAQDQVPGTFAEYMLKDRQPHMAVHDIDAGVLYGGYRDAHPGHEYWKIAAYIFPFYTMNPTGLLGAPHAVAARVPMDDTHTISFGMGSDADGGGRVNGAGSQPGGLRRHIRDSASTLPNSTDWYGRFRSTALEANDFFLDRELQRHNEGVEGWTGLARGQQDQMATDCQGPIADRTLEHLGSSDAMVIRVRQRLIQAAKAFAEGGTTPAGVDNPEFYRQRSGGTYLPKGVDWFEATQELRTGFVEQSELDWSVTGGA